MWKIKINYQIKTDEIIKSLNGEKKSLLLQCCCGPCASYVVEYLAKYFNLTVLFYNPNIQPFEEYEKRKDTLKELLTRFENVDFMDCDYDGESFQKISKGLEEEREGGARCTACFVLRLNETAKLAKEMSFEYFCTTLSVSPHKDQVRINEIGESLGEKYGVPWLYSDFKKKEGYKISTQRSREYNLYRQDYCGCLYSKNID